MLNKVNREQLIYSLISTSTNPNTRRSRIEHIRPISGGFTGAQVFLLWLSELPAIIVKAGPASEIAQEFSARRDSMTPSDIELGNIGLAHLSDTFAFQDSTGTQEWKAMVYPYVGGRDYRHLSHFTDFEGFVNRFQAGEVTVDTLEECLRQVIQALTIHPTTNHDAENPLPLSQYLPMPIWSNGLSNILAITSTLLPNEKNLGDLQEWTESQVNSMLAIPIPDRRRLHGDARFANILVDNVHSSIELIDYGNAQIGHVFQDFARFEVDLWFRSSSNLNHDKQSSNSLAIAETALRRLTIDDDHPLSSSPLRYWRDALLDTFPGFGAPGALQLYRWFLFVELLKRLKWIRENSTSESGTDALTLLQCIAWIRSSIQSSDPLLASALVGNAISSLLHCRAVYVPTTDREREVNRTRNEAKKSAIRKTAQVKGMMRLIAETGNAYFDTRGVFYDEIESLLRKGGEVRAILCDPQSTQADEIQMSYETSASRSSSLLQDFLRKYQESLVGIGHLKRRYGDKMMVREARNTIGATILLAEGSTFFEPYLRVNRSLREHLLFDTFELEFDSSQVSRSEQIFSAHFDFLWRAGSHNVSLLS